jgi:23S rRNA (cytosine1962-C5)-methyltransferase
MYWGESMETCRITLKPNEETRIKNGHPWVYNNEIASIQGAIISGGIADVFSHRGEFIGRGLLNTASKIFVRILSRQAIEINEEFFRDRIVRANQSRLELGFENSYRVFFGEADGIPGLIVDKYSDYLSIQILSLGIDQRKAIIIKILIDIFHPQGIIERSDAAVRIKEGLEEYKGVIYGKVPEFVEIIENGIHILVDLYHGQKTGYFLDQQENHASIKPYVINKTVLDCFSHTGGFGLHAAFYGAKEVTCVDLSQTAIDAITRHCALNHLSNLQGLRADVFNLLREKVADKIQYGVVILDPPAFTKNLENVKKAYSGYKEINLQAMKLIESGGYLITNSCSHYMTPALFLEMLMEAAVDSGRIAQMVEFRTQGKDHPALLGSEESFYLKCVILRIIDKY